MDEFALVPTEPTEEMLLAGHHQIDWCRNGQHTGVNEHPTQTKLIGGKPVGTTCKQDLQDAWRAMLATYSPPCGWTGAAKDVLAERARQVQHEGWSAEHDDDHDKGELARAAAGYAYHAGLTDEQRFKGLPQGWPAGWAFIWWKPSTRRRDLVKAGALILAEIDRLDRLEANGRQPPSVEADACPVCERAFVAGDLCATDIELGMCHAACLAGTPVVELDTGEPSNGPVDTYPYEPEAAR